MANVAVERAPKLASLADHPAPVVTRAEGLTAESASAALGTLEPGGRVFWLSKGAVSLADVLGAVLSQIGPADLMLATWTIAGQAIDTLRAWLASGAVRSLRVLVDASFLQRHGEYAAALRAAFGADRVALANCHLKLCVLRNSAWSVVVVSSANLNKAARLESYVVEDNPALADFVLSTLSDWFADAADSWAVSRAAHSAQLAAWRESAPAVVEADPVEAGLLAALGRGLGRVE